jgi:hypothetical protein
MVSLILFIFSVMGLTNIIVDPGAIMVPFRNFVSKYGFAWMNKLLSCYQCCGTWVGFLCGYVFISKNPLEVFLCGMAGSYIATVGTVYLNYLEAQSVLNLND